MPVELSSVAPETLRELERIDHRHAVRFALFVAIYLASAALTLWIVSMYGSGWATLFCLPLYISSAASLHGISLFTHEGVHGGLSRSRFWNRAFSIACALPVLQNFSAYRVLHMRHHHDTGGSHDPDHYENYSGRSWLLFLMHWGRLLVGYPAYITLIPILALRHGKKADRLWTLFESALLILLVTGALLSPIPRAWLLHAWLLPMVIINTLVNIRGMSQHTLLDEPEHPIRGTRTILASPMVAFFMCNENFHLEHHLYPRVPWYNLPRLHALLKPQLVGARAPFIPSYFSFVRHFAVHSLKWVGKLTPQDPLLPME